MGFLRANSLVLACPSKVSRVHLDTIETMSVPSGIYKLCPVTVSLLREGAQVTGCQRFPWNWVVIGMSQRAVPHKHNIVNSMWPLFFHTLCPPVIKYFDCRGEGVYIQNKPTIRMADTASDIWNSAENASASGFFRVLQRVYFEDWLISIRNTESAKKLASWHCTLLPLVWIWVYMNAISLA